ncbi:MAG: HAD family phosphatase [Bacteroidia bacterium]|nr:HAD family phosphatase [Bacteroidia bacterium]
MKNPIDTIVFDLGGVLIDWNPRYVYRTIFDSEEKVESFLANVCVSSWNEEQDRGRSLKEGTEILLAKHPEWEKEIRAFYDRWPEMLGGPIQGSVDILESLKVGKNYRLYALTNWSDETFPVALGRYDFLQWFEGILVSGKEKLIKPDPAIYKLLFERFNIDPEKAIFIDDSLKNVEGAKAVGMHAIHFRSPMQMREELAELL